ncbi:MAG: hypothetical protein ACE5JU_07970 [Candidatus Binatia bacterium]
MSTSKAGLCSLFFILLLGGCEPVPLQYPPGSSPYPSANAPAPAPSQAGSLPPLGTLPKPQVSGAQRGQYIWDKAMEGIAMGGSIAGPYGAGAGLVFGGLFGLLTADSYYEQLNAQIQSEQEKDKQLEAQLEEEMKRQRELEAKLENRENSSEPKEREEGKREARPAASMPSFKNIDIRDVNRDGVPDLWITYDPLKPGEVIRQEEDTNWDGRVDTWSYFTNAKLIRREVDSDGDGRGDRFFVYKNESLVREERDGRGDGHPSFRAIYERGRLAKVEKDLNQDGKMDLWVYYDIEQPEEVTAIEERDLNGDGAVDLWSYYEGGRLVRRDVSAVGLDYLSKQGRPLPEVLPQALPKS